MLGGGKGWIRAHPMQRLPACCPPSPVPESVTAYPLTQHIFLTFPQEHEMLFGMWWQIVVETGTSYAATDCGSEGFWGLGVGVGAGVGVGVGGGGGGYRHHLSHSKPLLI